MTETRYIFMPCECGKIHKIPDPGRNMRFCCRSSEASLLYESKVGEDYRLRGGVKDYILDTGEIKIGRRVKDGIIINDQTLSRHHATLNTTNDGYSLTDNGSSNGTFVNERQLFKGTTAKLVAGDLIRFGNVFLRFITPEDIEPQLTVVTTPAIAEDETEEIATDDRMETSVAGSADPLIGKLVGMYRIQSVLSQGGMGRIYRARHISLDRDCVLKTIRPDLAADPDVMDRFLREITLGAKVWHPNVVAFYDAGQSDDFIYLSMEYFPGKTLWDLYHNCPASTEEIIQVGISGAAALEAAHAEGVIHRDIKPRNIMVNGKGVVKIVDFGVAKAFLDQGHSSLTLTGAIVGTPAYMAPEQISNPGGIDHRIDIYGLGAVMYFCATGHAPYVGKGAGQILRQVGKSIPRPSQVRRGFPLQLEGIIIKAMSADPGKRYANASEMLDAFEKLDM